MAGRRSDGSDRRGGESIQAPRPGHARLATGAIAFLAAAGLASYPAFQDLRLHFLAVGLGGLGLTFLALGLAARSGPALGWGIAALGGEYAVLVASQGRVLVEVTPVYAAAFIFVAELGFWSIERRVGAWSEAGLLVRRLAYLAGTCAGAAAMAALVLVLAAASRGGGAVLEAVGVAATIAALTLLAVLVRRSVAEVDSQA